MDENYLTIKKSIDSVKEKKYEPSSQTEEKIVDTNKVKLDDLVDFKPNEELDLVEHIHYASQDEQLQADAFYFQKQNEDAGDKSPFADDEERYTHDSDVESEQMTTEEAQEAIEELQYATLTGSTHEISCIKRRKLSNHFLYNSTLANLSHQLNSLTSNVDYSYNN